MSPEEKKEIKPVKVKKMKAKKAVSKTGKKTKETKARDIGVDVPVPGKTCDDINCPFHGRLSVRGQMLKGQVVSDKMDNSVVITRARLHYVPKYERYEKRTSRYTVHNPPCLEVKVGDEVTFMECKPLSKTKSFVVISKKSR